MCVFIHIELKCQCRPHSASFRSGRDQNCGLPKGAPRFALYVEIGSIESQPGRNGTFTDEALTGVSAPFFEQVKCLKEWRPRRESNPCTRICSPLRSHSATRPLARRRQSAIDRTPIAASGAEPQESNHQSRSVSCCCREKVVFGLFNPNPRCYTPLIANVIPDSSVGRASDC